MKLTNGKTAPEEGARRERNGARAGRGTGEAADGAMWGRSRPPLARMLRLHEWMTDSKYPNCRKMAEEFEVSAKTIQRDINFMRDQLGLPIDYDERHFGFFYTHPVHGFPPKGAAFKGANGTGGEPPASSAWPGSLDFFPALQKGQQVVRIQFEMQVAQAVRDRGWHGSQKMEELPDGRIEVTFHLESTDGLERWVVSWGEYAKVIAPDALRRRVGRIARAMLKHYDSA